MLASALSLSKAAKFHLFFIFAQVTIVIFSAIDTASGLTLRAAAPEPTVDNAAFQKAYNDHVKGKEVKRKAR